jgi:hypothetical protein
LAPARSGCSPFSELGMLKLSSVPIDALAEVGGQCTALYPEKPIFDIPADPAIEAGALIRSLHFVRPACSAARSTA